MGAQVTAASSGTTATVAAGHGFAADDKLIVGTDATAYRTVSAVTSTTLTLNSAIALADGDLLVNLARDTGTIAPNYDGAGLTVYTDMDYTNTATYNSVITDQYGRYRYFHKGLAIWELVRSAFGPIAIYTSDGDILYSKVGDFETWLTSGRGTSVGMANAYGQFGGIYMSHPTTTSGAQGITWGRGGNANWVVGEDYRTGTLSYLAVLCDQASFVYGTGAIQSGDVLGISWAGADSGAQDGPAWTFNLGGFNPAIGDYDAGFEYQFGMQSKRTTGTGRRTAWFKPVSAQAGLTSGGVDISLVGNTPGLRISQLVGSAWRSTIQFGTQDANANYWALGHDFPNLQTQTFSLYNYKTASYAWYCDAIGMGIGNNAPAYKLDVTGTARVSGVSTLTGGIQGGIVTHSGTWPVQSATAGTDSVCQANKIYLGSVYVPLNGTITGVAYLVGSVGGTSKVIASIYDISGNLLSSSAVAGTVVGTAAQVQLLPLTTPASLAIAGPGYYWIGLTFDSTGPGRLRTVPAQCQAGSGVMGNILTQTFGTPAAIVCPTTFTLDTVPVAHFY